MYRYRTQYMQYLVAHTIMDARLHTVPGTYQLAALPGDSNNSSSAEHLVRTVHVQHWDLNLVNVNV